ncbi:MAG: aldose sugar dehydrogenase, partial [Hyphomicrobiales bacterium]|nr:aldose sugar dehydrogenase [Hyphomicrobiales bacterium]
MTSRIWIAAVLALGAAPAAAQTFPSSAGTLNVETVARGLDHPWSIAFLPGGRMLVTERPGRLRIVARDGKLSPPVAGVPKVMASGQGGLHDVALDRDFATNKTVYFCFAEPAQGGGRTALARARLTDDDEIPKLDEMKVIFRQEGPLSSGNHYGCRIVQGRDGNLWLTMGDHFVYRVEAQNLANHIGKIVRLTPDGAVPPDNPFVGR